MHQSTKPNLHVNLTIQLHLQRRCLKLLPARSRPALRRLRLPPFQCRRSLLALRQHQCSRLVPLPRQHHLTGGLRLLSPALRERQRLPHFSERRLLLGLALCRMLPRHYLAPHPRQCQPLVQQLSLASLDSRRRRQRLNLYSHLRLRHLPLQPPALAQLLRHRLFLAQHPPLARHLLLAGLAQRRFLARQLQHRILFPPLVQPLRVELDLRRRVAHLFVPLSALPHLRPGDLTPRPGEHRPGFRGQAAAEQADLRYFLPRGRGT